MSIKDFDICEGYSQHAKTASITDREMKFQPADAQKDMAKTAIKYHTRAMNTAPSAAMKADHKAKIDAHRAKFGITESELGEAREFSAHAGMDHTASSRLKDKKTGATKGIFNTHSAASTAHKNHPEKSKLMIEDTKYPMISFKDYLQIKEEQEHKLDMQILAARRLSKNESVEESSPFDWKKTKSEINWKADETGYKDNTGKHKGTYGSETHVAPSEKNMPKEKKSVGRPVGAYDKNYKIDRSKRDTKEYKDALSAKVRATKADGFAARDEFRKGMDAAIKKHQLKLAGIDK